MAVMINRTGQGKSPRKTRLPPPGLGHHGQCSRTTPLSGSSTPGPDSLKHHAGVCLIRILNIAARRKVSNFCIPQTKGTPAIIQNYLFGSNNDDLRGLVSTPSPEGEVVPPAGGEA
jgi:hypothetical protein